MSTSIRPFTADLTDAVGALNRRLSQAAAAQHVRLGNRFPESPGFPWPAPTGNGTPYHELFVAYDEGAVRGGYVLKQQQFLLKGQPAQLAQYRLPISEGFVDPRYAGVGVQLLLDAQRRQPLLYTIGIGGFEEPMAKMLKAAGWSMAEVPFFFRIERPAAFLRNIKYLRNSFPRRLALDFLAFSGLGSVGVRLVQNRRTRPARRPPVDCDYTLEATHASWADEIWHEARSNYSLIALRDQANLQALYPEGDYRFIRLKVTDRQGLAGWAVLLNPRMDDHGYFGSMRVGTIVDCLARPGAEGAVVTAACRYLRSNEADLILGNFSHRAWRDALLAAGFMRQPSNYLFAASRKLAAALDPFATDQELAHWTRGDGSGPENLFGHRCALFI